jgi:hypothetical protein
MDMAFLLGLFCGFLLGSSFCVVVGRMIRYEVYQAIIQAKNHPHLEEEDEDDSVNFWKPKGWKPDE